MVQDVCDVLGITIGQAVDILHVEEMRFVWFMDSVGEEQKTLAINDFGLYAVASESGAQEAGGLEHWLCHEVLPSISKTVPYSGDELQSQREFMTEKIIKASRLLAETSARLEDKLGCQVRSLLSAVEQLEERIKTLEDTYIENALSEVSTLH